MSHGSAPPARRRTGLIAGIILAVALPVIIATWILYDVFAPGAGDIDNGERLAIPEIADPQPKGPVTLSLSSDCGLPSAEIERLLPSAERLDKPSYDNRKRSCIWQGGADRLEVDIELYKDVTEASKDFGPGLRGYDRYVSHLGNEAYARLSISKATSILFRAGNALIKVEDIGRAGPELVLSVSASVATYLGVPPVGTPTITPPQAPETATVPPACRLLSKTFVDRLGSNLKSTSMGDTRCLWTSGFGRSLNVEIQTWSPTQAKRTYLEKHLETRAVQRTSSSLSIEEATYGSFRALNGPGDEAFGIHRVTTGRPTGAAVVVFRLGGRVVEVEYSGRAGSGPIAEGAALNRAHAAAVEVAKSPPK